MRAGPTYLVLKDLNHATGIVKMAMFKKDDDCRRLSEIFHPRAAHALLPWHPKPFAQCKPGATSKSAGNDVPHRHAGISSIAWCGHHSAWVQSEAGAKLRNPKGRALEMFGEATFDHSRPCRSRRENVTIVPCIIRYLVMGSATTWPRSPWLNLYSDPKDAEVSAAKFGLDG